MQTDSCATQCLGIAFRQPSIILSHQVWCMGSPCVHRVASHLTTVNAIRTKIVVFWLLFVALLLLLQFSWSHRLLWLLLFLAAEVIAGSIGPRVSYPQHRLKVLRILFGFAGVVFLFAFIVHGFFLPKSEILTVALKFLMSLALIPALCYKAHCDYVALGRFRAAND